jgi:3-mercaptopropionate dioxygenase
MPLNHPSLNAFVTATTTAIAQYPDEAALLPVVDLLLKQLIANDDWLPLEWRAPDSGSYRQLPLFLDPQGRFSVTSFIWGPGQSTPIHNHTTWGIVGVLQGAELCREYAPPIHGKAGPFQAEHLLKKGQTDWVSPTVGDWHQVSNAFSDQVSISIHVYGADIGKIERQAIDPATQKVRAFVSGYSAATPVNVN